MQQVVHDAELPCSLCPHSHERASTRTTATAQSAADRGIALICVFVIDQYRRRPAPAFAACGCARRRAADTVRCSASCVDVQSMTMNYTRIHRPAHMRQPHAAAAGGSTVALGLGHRVTGEAAGWWSTSPDVRSSDSGHARHQEKQKHRLDRLYKNLLQQQRMQKLTRTAWPCAAASLTGAHPRLACASPPSARPGCASGAPACIIAWGRAHQLSWGPPSPPPEPGACPAGRLGSTSASTRTKQHLPT